MTEYKNLLKNRRNLCGVGAKMLHWDIVVVSLKNQLHKKM